MYRCVCVLCTFCIDFEGCSLHFFSGFMQKDKHWLSLVMLKVSKHTCTCIHMHNNVTVYTFVSTLNGIYKIVTVFECTSSCTIYILRLYNYM